MHAAASSTSASPGPGSSRVTSSMVSASNGGGASVAGDPCARRTAAEVHVVLTMSVPAWTGTRASPCWATLVPCGVAGPLAEPRVAARYQPVCNVRPGRAAASDARANKVAGARAEGESDSGGGLLHPAARGARVGAAARRRRERQDELAGGVQGQPSGQRCSARDRRACLARSWMRHGLSGRFEVRRACSR